MKSKQKYWLYGILVLAIVGIVFISGCITQEAKSVCGNGIVESWEECDGTGCTSDKICTENCKCESLPPPALPE